MANRDKKVDLNKSFHLDKTKTIIGILGVLLLCAVITIVVLLTGNKKDNDIIPITDALGVGDVAAVEVANSEKERLVTLIGTSLEDISNRNIFMNVQDGTDSYVTIVYNKDGESFAQASESGYITVYRNDHKAIRYTDYIDFGYDSDVISLLRNVHQMAKDGKAEILTTTEDDAIEGYRQVIVDIRGWDRIAELYGMFDKDFSDLMVEQLKSAVVEASANEESGINADDETNFRFVFAINDSTKTLDSSACYIYFGDKASKDVIWSDLSASWAYNGYREVYDWKLTDEWYTTDWDKISEWEDTTAAEELLNTQFTSLMDMLNQYAIDNGEEPMLPSEDDSSEPSETSDSEGDTNQNKDESSQPVDNTQDTDNSTDSQPNE